MLRAATTQGASVRNGIADISNCLQKVSTNPLSPPLCFHHPLIMYLNMTLKSQMSICAAKPDLEEISSTPENAVLARSKEGTVQYVIIYTGYSMI